MKIEISPQCTDSLQNPFHYTFQNHYLDGKVMVYILSCVKASEGENIDSTERLKLGEFLSECLAGSDKLVLDPRSADPELKARRALVDLLVSGLMEQGSLSMDKQQAWHFDKEMDTPKENEL